MRSKLLFVGVLAILAAGCGAANTNSSPDTTPDTTPESAPDTTTTGGELTTIAGELTYLQRIALIPGGTATITVSDVSLQDVAAPVIGEITLDLEDQQVPIPFELSIDSSVQEPGHTYALQATIHGPSGDLEWTTDTTNEIDLNQTTIDMGELVLVQVGPSVGPDPSMIDPAVLVGEWNVTTIDGFEVVADTAPTLIFTEDGEIGGDAGCNSYSSRYTTSGPSITVETEIVSTMMACSPDVDEQESTLLTLLANVVGFQITDGNALLLISKSGAGIEATR